MPLLGRHKSLPGNHHNQQQQQQKAKPLLCESPLFGTRSQLPVATSATIVTSIATGHRGSASTSGRHHAQLASSKSSQASLSSSASNSNAHQSLSGPDTLNSIPKQISRQQIHYAFSIMDTNSDGLIDLRDLSQALANLGVPIDEAILAHVMASVVSKRGDHRISETEFLDWLGNFIQVSEQTNQSDHHHNNSARQKRTTTVARSASATTTATRRQTPAQQTSLLAHDDMQLAAAGHEVRRRRGSGSGLALMRSLSTGSSGSSSSNADQTTTTTTTEQVSGGQAASNSQRGKHSFVVGDILSAHLGADECAQLLDEQRLANELEARNDLAAAFCVFDLDGDGFITLDEVQQGLKLLGESWTPSELEQLFERCAPPPPAPAQQLAGKRHQVSLVTTGASKKQQQHNNGADLKRQRRINIDDFVRMLL